MELRDLRTFAAVVDLGRFTLAAKRLHIVQPAVSQAVARLETEVGLKLLERKPGATVPTPAGMALWRHAQVVLNSVASAEQDMTAYRGLGKGSVNVGLVSGATTLILTRLLKRLRAEHPGLAIRVEESDTPHLLESIRLRHLDLAIVFLPVDAPDLLFAPVAELSLTVAVSPDHPVASRKRIQFKALAKERWISFPPGNPGRIYLDSACEKAGFRPLIEAEVTSFSQLKSFVEAGYGLGFLTANSFSTEIRAGTLAQVGVSPPSSKVTIACVYDRHHVGEAPAAVRTIISEAAADMMLDEHSQMGVERIDASRVY